MNRTISDGEFVGLYRLIVEGNLRYNIEDYCAALPECRCKEFKKMLE